MSSAIELEPAIYELIGRVIVETALLEGRLIELAIRLEWQANNSKMFEDLQAKHGGSGGTRLKEGVERLARAVGPDLDQTAFAAFIGRVAERQSERNTLAHDMLFPLTGTALAGFRTVSKTQRSAADEVTQCVVLTQERLAEDLRLAEEVSREALEWVRRFPCPPFRDTAEGSSG